MKKYKKIQFDLGSSIDSAMKQLLSQDTLATGVFNEVQLYSDIDTLDSAYLKIVGITKAASVLKKEEQRKRWKKEEEEHAKAIPALIEKYTKEGKEILEEKYHKEWTDIVPIRVDDIYKGLELKNSLTLIKKLNDGDSLEDVAFTINGQGHSGMSFQLVRAIVRKFSERGGAFFESLS